ncbi:MAG: SGNH/GDSL hydrolase family protein, partial [Myxococcota bacterium]
MTSTTRRFGVSLMAVLVAGCLRGGPRPCSDQDSDILVIGDSVLRFHSEACASVPDVLGERLGRSVRNEAVKGARVTAGPLYAFGDLHGQYEVG